MNDCPRQNPAYRPAPTIHPRGQSRFRTLTPSCLRRFDRGVVAGRGTGRGLPGHARAIPGRSFGRSRRPTVPEPRPRFHSLPAFPTAGVASTGAWLPVAEPGAKSRDTLEPSLGARSAAPGGRRSLDPAPGSTPSGVSNRRETRSVLVSPGFRPARATRPASNFDRSRHKPLSRLTIAFRITIVHFSGKLW